MDDHFRETRGPQDTKPYWQHRQNLIAALLTVDVGVVEDPNFLERSILVAGVRRVTSPKRLLDIFQLLSPVAAVTVRDLNVERRVGLVVFSNADDMAEAMNMTRLGSYACCIPANRGAYYSRTKILEALRFHSLQLPNAELLRSLVPPQYILDDEEMDLHLRCIFIAGAARVSGGAYGLCGAIEDKLLQRVSAQAVILHRARDAAVLVFENAVTVELLTKRARQHQELGVRLLGCSLFPLPAADAGSCKIPQLPNFLTDYGGSMCRVLLLTGLDTEHWDACAIAYSIQRQLGSIAVHASGDHDVEAVIIHKQQDEDLAFVVLGSSEGADVLLQEQPEVWTELFGSLVVCSRPFQEPEFCPRLKPWEILPEVYREVESEISRSLKRLETEETGQIAHCLTALCTLAYPDVVRSPNFLDRTLLLSGVVDLSWSSMSSRLSEFGELDALLVNEGKKMALCVYKSRLGAVRLLLQLTATWLSLGFTGCQRPPVAQAQVDELLRADSDLRHVDFNARAGAEWCLAD